MVGNTKLQKSLLSPSQIPTYQQSNESTRCQKGPSCCGIVKLEFCNKRTLARMNDRTIEI